MMAFSKEDRAKGVTSGELVSCAPAPDRKRICRCPHCGTDHDCSWPKPAPDREGELAVDPLEGNAWKATYHCPDCDLEVASREEVVKLARTITALRRQVETAREALEHITELFVDTARLGFDPEKEVAVINARTTINSLKTEG